MRRLRGRPVSPGYAQGTAVVHNPGAAPEVPHYRIQRAEVESEQDRFRRAVQRSHEELKRLEARVLAVLGRAQSAILSAHLGLLRDPKFTARVNERIRRDLVNVEQALEVEVAELCALLATVEDDYIRQRAQDIRDVAGRVMRQLMRTTSGQYYQLPPHSVIVATELLPSETIDLDRRHVAAIVTEVGGRDSHAAILARALGIPAITGVRDAVSEIPPGAQLLVDGENGWVTITPSEHAVHDFASLKAKYDKAVSAAAAEERHDCATRDGTRIELLANINRPHEARWVLRHALDGVGLFRTEFMFMDSPVAPGLQRQLQVYGEAARALEGRPLTVRTLDLGGDKIPDFLTRDHEMNPHLGMRGLRFSLAERAMFETQLRAIVGAAGQGDVRVLFPMVLGPSDFGAGIEILRAIASDLGATDVPPAGAMIETPAALFALEEILELADFVSIGTNDLTQFMLAADRDAAELAHYSILHPSVLRAIARVVEASRAAGRQTCVCGEAAGDPRMACVLVGLGIRQLSMSPMRAARVRYALRTADLRQLEQIAQRTLDCRGPDEVQQLVDEHLGPRSPAS